MAEALPPLGAAADRCRRLLCVRRLLNDDLPGPTVYINWGKFGEYELKIAEDGLSMAGSAKGNPDNWRKATRRGGSDVGEANAHLH